MNRFLEMLILYMHTPVTRQMNDPMIFTDDTAEGSLSSSFHSNDYFAARTDFPRS